jgi:allantoinase
LLLCGALVADHESAAIRDILVGGGRILRVEPGLEGKLTADIVERLDGRLILPGAIDPHVHFEEPGNTRREDFESGTRAAAAGGITLVIEHPLSDPPTTTTDRYVAKRELVSRHAHVDFGLWGGAVPGNVDEMPGMVEAGAGGFKAFMLESEPDYPGLDDDRLLTAMKLAAELGTTMLVHAEDGSIIEAATAQLQAAGRKDAIAWAESRPAISEVEAVGRAIALAHQASCRAHLVHLTTGESVALAAEARRRGDQVCVETCPHYLLFDSSALARLGPWVKCAPPLRSRYEVERLWEHVLAGRVDFIGSDHAPWEYSEKSVGLDDIWAARNGLQSLQFTTVLMLDSGAQRGLALDALVRLLSTNIAQWLGIFPQKGTIQPGSDADLAVYRAGVSHLLRADDLLDKQKWTPYEGTTVAYQVEATMLRGAWVYRDGVVTEPPRGAFVPMPRQAVSPVE